MYRFSWQFMKFPGLFEISTTKTPGEGQCLFKYEPFPDLSLYACQIWSRSDGPVEKRGGRDTQTEKHTKGRRSFI